MNPDPKSPPRRFWRRIWPLVCVGLFAAGVAGWLPDGAMLVVGPAVALVWALTLREMLRGGG